MKNLRAEITALLFNKPMRESELRAALNDIGFDWLRSSKEIEKLVSTKVIARYKDSLGYFYKIRKQEAGSVEEKPIEEQVCAESEQNDDESLQEDEVFQKDGENRIPLPEIDVQFSFTLGKTSIKETLESIAENAIIAAIRSGAYPEIVWHKRSYTHIPINEITRLIGGSPDTNQRIIDGMVEKGVIDRVEFLDLVFYCVVIRGGK